MKKYLSVFLAVVVLAGLCLLGAVPAGAEETTDYEPPANLNELSQAEQLEYFNLVVNRVRTEQPGFTQKSLLAIDSIRLSGAAAVANSIIDAVKNKLMPGEWATQEIDAGISNEDCFFSENANASDLRPEDITGIGCTKNGDYWVIELDIVKETNPAPGLASANGRIAPVITREQMLEEVAGISDAISADPKDASLRYYDGFACVIVNGEGKITAGTNGHRVQAQANNVKISTIRTNISTEQRSEWQYVDFSWTTTPSPALPAHKSPTPTPPSFLARLWNFILKWFLFGWIWMN